MTDQFSQPASPKVALVSRGDPGTRKLWSGTPYYMSRALTDENVTVSHIGMAEAGFIRQLERMAKLTGKVTQSRGMPTSSWLATQLNAGKVKRSLSTQEVDFILAPAGSNIIADLDVDIPIIYTSDATVRLLIDYYGKFSSLNHRALRRAEDVEQAAIDRASILSYPSHWAAQSAIDHYGADPAKVHVHPYGANMECVPDRAEALAPRRADRCELLFVGVEWDRKGGDIAVDALAALNARGMPTHLSVVGCIPPDRVPRDNLTVYPFLSKHDPVQAAKLTELYMTATLFFVPTRAECYGVVWCEAAAHGLPSIATATGGVPDVIHEGRTGHTLPPEAGGQDYADLIEGLARDRDRLDALRISARDDFETRLDWAVWGRSLTGVMRSFGSGSALAGMQTSDPNTMKSTS